MTGIDPRCNDGAHPQAGADRLRSGAQAERRAEDHLSEHGLRTEARNVRFRGGELDLVMRDGDSLVFVEVRSRARAGFGGAAASVGPRKQRRLVLAAQLYLLRRFGQGAWPPCRFDVVAIEQGRLRWVKGAFTSI